VTPDSQHGLVYKFFGTTSPMNGAGAVQELIVPHSLRRSRFRWFSPQTPDIFFAGFCLSISSLMSRRSLC
jgi:hypothetical protein